MRLDFPFGDVPPGTNAGLDAWLPVAASHTEPLAGPRRTVLKVADRRCIKMLREMFSSLHSPAFLSVFLL